MTIQEIRFRNGIELKRSRNWRDIVKDNWKQADVITHSPGTFDVTPALWDDSNYQYILHVGEDGDGSIELVPRHKSSHFTEAQVWPDGRTKRSQEPMRSMIKPLNEDSEVVVIAGGHPEYAAALYAVIFWLAEEAPEQ